MINTNEQLLTYLLLGNTSIRNHSVLSIRVLQMLFGQQMEPASRVEIQVREEL